MSQPEFDSLLEKYLAGKCSQAEEAAVLEWYQTFIQDSDISMSASEKEGLERKVWSNIRSNIRLDRKIFAINSIWKKIGVAASLLLISGLGAYLINREIHDASPTIAFDDVAIPANYTSTSNDSKETKTIQLIDGSSVSLQPGSKIYYPRQSFNGNSRDVFLAGNAFFEVAANPDQHFMVYTSEGMIAEVLGTSFYVLQDTERKKVEVEVISGKVSVYEHHGRSRHRERDTASSVILSPNQKVTYKPEHNRFVTTLVEKPQPVKIHSDQETFSFEEAKLSTVLETLEDVYGIQIEVNNPGFANCHFTGDISKQDLYEKLDVICKSVQAAYEIKGTMIYINGNGCK